MKLTKETRSHTICVIAAELLLLSLVTASQVDGGNLSPAALKDDADQLKVTRTGTEVPQSPDKEPFTLKTDPLTGEVNFNTKTVDINVAKLQKDRENAEKVAIIQKDLQSRIKVTDNDHDVTSPSAAITPISTEDPAEVLRKQVKVKEDLESRIMVQDDDKRYRADADEYYENYKHPIKRADVEYYEDEPTGPEGKPVSLPQRMTTEAPKEEDSFFSIFESLFGSGDEEKKTKVEEKQPEEANMKQNIKTVAEILKPVKTHEELQVKSGYSDRYDDPEYRIINEYPQKQGFRPSDPRPYQQYTYPQRPNSVRPPYQQFRPYPTPGYEDYDLEEFVDKNDKFTTERQTTPKLTSVSTTTTTTTTTTKTFYNTNRPKTPVAEKKSDTVGKTSQYSNAEKVTEKGTFYTVKPSAETHYQQPRPSAENKFNEVKTEKIQDSANFYNLINLPVRYSTKDTAIPLISTSYANTKIQGMGANKYDTNNSGKYPNHKYDSVGASSNGVSTIRTTTTTKRPNYWSARRTTTTTQRPATTPKPVSTTRYIPSTTKQTPRRPDFGHLDYDDLAIGSSANFGGYGNKAGATKITETKVPHNIYAETTTRRVYETQKNKDTTQLTQTEKAVTTTKMTSKAPPKDVYDEYEYDGFPAVVQEVKPPKESSNIKLHSTYSEKNKVYDTTADSSYKTYNKTTTTSTEPVKVEPPEYEYYEYETDITVSPSSTTTTTTPKYRVKYPSLQKDKIKTTSEKVAVVVPSNSQDYYVDDLKDTTSTATITVSPKSPTTSTTSTRKETTTTTTTGEPIQSQESGNFKGSYNQYYRPKEPAPVFEESDESDEYTPRPVSIHTQRRTTTTEKPTSEVKPIIVTATKKDQDNNVNIVLVPMKEPQKEVSTEINVPKTEKPSAATIHNKFNRPNDIYHGGFDYTTEFTVGAVHGHGGSISGQGHFVASSISANPYDDDEPFRPISKPPGLSASFQVVADQNDLRRPSQEIQTQTSKVQADRRPALPPTLSYEESEPIHEPHEFIPSPQFHRPEDSKITNTVQTGASEISVDYDFDGIQTEPKPGQYVIFSKPQLNPEMNEGALKKKPDVITTPPKVSSVSHYHGTSNKFNSESHKQSPYSTKPAQFYTTLPSTVPTEKPTELKRPSFPIPPELLDERLSLQLVPPKGVQTEKPFEANFVTPEYEKAESVANYPRPHWEKNGKPGFLLNSLANKNELNSNRSPLVPPQMAPTLIPPSSAIPQRFRKPPPPQMPPIRKNFNEGSINTKPKPNLPNILPQFRPNAKIGTGPYQRPFHRPQGYVNANRRNGPPRYHDKEGNFPYRIHHPSEKDALLYRGYDLEQDIYPKFINNRGKIPSEFLDPHAMHKRYGGGPPNVATRRVYQYSTDNPKFLRRLQRTPVTTLQMLQQIPGIRTHKNPVLREDGEDPSVPLVPPVYQPYKDRPNQEKNVHVVYPSNVHKSRYPAINEQDKFDNINYEFAKNQDQYPLLNPTRRTNQDMARPEFPYGFVKPNDKLKLIRKTPEENEMTNKNTKVSTDDREIKPNLQDYMPTATKKPIPSSQVKDEKIDMNLHMQSNNQWNKVNAHEEDLIIITQNPLDALKSSDGDNGRNGEHQGSDLKRKTDEGSQIRINPPSEYHTSIKDEGNSAFTLGAVMHTIPEGNKRGQVMSVSLSGDDLNIRNLDVNQRIANGKIVTVSMPLDVKEDPKEKEKKKEAHYNFQAPFQASSSIISNGAQPTNQGWSIVKNEGDTDTEDERQSESSGHRNTTKFNFENFKPELIGGFKPIYELPENEPRPMQVKSAESDDSKNREEKQR